MASATRASFTTIPAELRGQIYHHIVPAWYEISLEPKPGSVDKNGNRKIMKRPVVNTCTFRNCGFETHSACALMQTCKLVHEELDPILYSKILQLPAIHRLGLAENIIQHTTSRFLRLFSRLQLRHVYNGKVGEKSEKAQIKYILGKLPELREFEWSGLDASACAKAKGSTWKPYELRKLKTVLDDSHHLCKAFHDLSDSTGRTAVRFTDEAGEAREWDVELDVDAEYELWKMANRERSTRKTLEAKT